MSKNGSRLCNCWWRQHFSTLVSFWQIGDPWIWKDTHLSCVLKISEFCMNVN